MIRHRLRVFQRPVTFKVVGNSGRTQGVIADFGRDARLLRAPLNHPVGVRLRHAVRRARCAPRGAEQW
jgi:hypothetical protein